MQQYIRRCNLFVTGFSGKGLDLSNLKIKFTIKRSDAQSPNWADITVYNLAPETARQIRDEFRTLTLQAGYDENYGVIFQGSIKQVRFGRENGTDTYVSIAAADGDQAYNFAVVNATLAAGSTQADQIAVAANSMKEHGVELGYVGDTGSTKLSRGKPMYGPARNYLRQSTRSVGMTYSIQDGKLQVVKRTAVLPGEAIEITSKTGLIGAAEQTEDGVKMRCLLNPMIRVGGRVKVLPDDVLEQQLQAPSSGESETPKKEPSPLSVDGVYRVLIVDYSGDNREGPWYADLTTLSVDASAPSGEEVSAE